MNIAYTLRENENETGEIPRDQLGFSQNRPELQNKKRVCLAVLPKTIICRKNALTCKKWCGMVYPIKLTQQCIKLKKKTDGTGGTAYGHSE